jgi:hypothetical protein
MCTGNFTRSWLTHDRVIRCGITLLVVTITFALAACSGSTSASTAPTPTAKPPTAATALPPAPRRLASDPVQLADDLVADEQALRDPRSSEALLTGAAHRQQAAYRALGCHPEWDAITRPRIPPSLLDLFDRNVDAQRQFFGPAASLPQDTLPAWRIESPAGAQGPMLFLPSTFAAYGGGGDILSPHDSIMAAGRYLAANGFAEDRDRALLRYNNWDRYVRAVNDYAAVLAADVARFAGYYRWDIYYRTIAGDVLLPIGYAATSPIPVIDYLATHPQ